MKKATKSGFIFLNINNSKYLDFGCFEAHDKDAFHQGLQNLL